MLSENRYGLIHTITATVANGKAEHTATLRMQDDLKQVYDRVPTTSGADEAYDDGDFFITLEGRKIEPLIPLKTDPGDPNTESRRDRSRRIIAQWRLMKRKQ